MKVDLSRYFPVSANIKKERKTFWILLAIAAAYSLIFFIQLFFAREKLFDWDYKTGMNILRENALMPLYTEVLAESLYGLYALTIASILGIIRNYASFWQGSKSIYLMRRLPDRFELHRRCLSMPIADACITLLVAAILFFLYYAVYIAVTPEQCLIPNQWMTWFGRI